MNERGIFDYEIFIRPRTRDFIELWFLLAASGNRLASPCLAKRSPNRVSSHRKSLNSRDFKIYTFFLDAFGNMEIRFVTQVINFFVNR